MARPLTAACGRDTGSPGSVAAIATTGATKVGVQDGSDIADVRPSVVSGAVRLAAPSVAPKGTTGTITLEERPALAETEVRAAAGAAARESRTATTGRLFMPAS
jgi:hypothetical protein